MGYIILSMREYLTLVDEVLTRGKEKTDPQKVGNISIAGHTMTFDLSDGQFPLVTVRDMSGSWRAIVGELLWYIRGSTNVQDLQAEGIHIWDQWAEVTQKEYGYQQGELGPIYGKQWRAFDGGGEEPVDQLGEAMGLLRTNPDSRRIIVTSWNPSQVDRVFIAPCHCFFQFHHAQGELSLNLFQRSGDVPVGIPFDTAEYALLLTMVAKLNNMTPKYLNHFIGDAHIYKDQIKHMKELLKREPKSPPKVDIRPGVPTIFDYKYQDFTLVGYESHPKMKIPVAL